MRERSEGLVCRAATETAAWCGGCRSLSLIHILATPLGLMALGASFDLKQAAGKIKPAIVATFIKLIGLAAIFLPIGVMLGYTHEHLIALIVMLGSASTVSCFVMARCV